MRYRIPEEDEDNILLQKSDNYNPIYSCGHKCVHNSLLILTFTTKKKNREVEKRMKISDKKYFMISKYQPKVIIVKLAVW